MFNNRKFNLALGLEQYQENAHWSRATFSAEWQHENNVSSIIRSMRSGIDVVLIFPQAFSETRVTASLVNLNF